MERLADGVQEVIDILPYDTGLKLQVNTSDVALDDEGCQPTAEVNGSARRLIKSNAPLHIASESLLLAPRAMGWKHGGTTSQGWESSY
jgi:hypothetical protein